MSAALFARLENRLCELQGHNTAMANAVSPNAHLHSLVAMDAVRGALLTEVLGVESACLGADLLHRIIEAAMLAEFICDCDVATADQHAALDDTVEAALTQLWED